MSLFLSTTPIHSEFHPLSTVYDDKMIHFMDNCVYRTVDSLCKLPKRKKLMSNMCNNEPTSNWKVKNHGFSIRIGKQLDLSIYSLIPFVKETIHRLTF